MKNLKNYFTLFILVLITSCSKDSDAPSTPEAPIVNLAITNISPTTGPKNTPVTITGTGFSATPANNAVTINGKVCPVVNSTATQITITIPPSAGSGKIKVTVAAANAESGNFEFVITTTVSTFAGSTRGLNDGQGSAAQFDRPKVIAFDSQGNLLVADGNRIRNISLTGLVTTVAGNGSFSGFLDGQGILARFNNVNGLAFSADGNLFVVDENNHKIRLISNTGLVNTTAGNVDGVTRGFLDGERFFVAKFDSPRGIAIDASNSLFIADFGNKRIRKIAGGNVTTFAGSGSFGSVDGQSITASFRNPTALAIDALSNLYVVDGQLIRKITSTGLVTTIAGSTNFGFADGQGIAARFNVAEGIVCDSQGNLFVADDGRIRKISSTGLVTTIAGTATNGFGDGNGSTAQFENTAHIAIDVQGNLYISDTKNFKIRKITFD